MQREPSLRDLQDALAAQQTQLAPGSILLVRTGWMGAASLRASDAQKKAMAPLGALTACVSRRTARWSDGCGTATSLPSGTDCPAVEPWPWAFTDEGALHYRTLSLLGLPLGEQFGG